MKVEAIQRAIDQMPGRRQADLAAATGLRQQRISKFLRGAATPRPEEAIAIHRATAGLVPASDIRPDLWPTAEHVPLAPVAAAASSEAVA